MENISHKLTNDRVKNCLVFFLLFEMFKADEWHSLGWMNFLNCYTYLDEEKELAEAVKIDFVAYIILKKWGHYYNCLQRL